MNDFVLPLYVPSDASNHAANHAETRLTRDPIPLRYVDVRSETNYHRRVYEYFEGKQDAIHVNTSAPTATGTPSGHDASRYYYRHFIDYTYTSNMVKRLGIAVKYTTLPGLHRKAPLFSARRGGPTLSHLQEGVNLHVRRRQPRLLVASKAVRIDGPPLCRDHGREDGRHDKRHEVCIGTARVNDAAKASRSRGSGQRNSNDHKSNQAFAINAACADCLNHMRSVRHAYTETSGSNISVVQACTRAAV